MSITPVPPVKRPESIRAWYKRTTAWSIKALVIATICSVTTIVLMCVFSSLPTLTKLQTANGALTIPLIGGVWIFGFIFMFLVPSREASFRGQESLEEGVDIVKLAIQEKLAPAAEVWARIGKRVEAELPAMIEKVKETLNKASVTMEDLKVASKKIEIAAEKGDKTAEDAKPAIESLKRIEASIEYQMKSGFFEDIRAMTQSVRSLTGLPPTQKEEPPIRMDWALEAIRKNKSANGKS